MKSNQILAIPTVALFLSTICLSFFFYRDVVNRDKEDLNSCAPYDIKYGTVESNITVQWKTVEPCVGFIRYGSDPSSLAMISTDPSSIGARKDHSVVLDNITQGESYYLVFYSNDESYGFNGSPLVVNMDNI